MNNFLRSMVLLLVMAFFVAVPSAPSAFGGGDYGKISIQELKASLGNPDMVIIDVRDSNSWSKSQLKIAGAVRENDEDVGSWAKKYPHDKTIVVY